MLPHNKSYKDYRKNRYNLKLIFQNTGHSEENVSELIK